MEEAKAEAEGAGGLMAAMALTRYETERLSLAQLRQAWYRAQYGIAFPTPVAPAAPKGATARVQIGSRKRWRKPRDPKNSAPAWVDPAHPEIDYTATMFEGLSRVRSSSWSGWWAVQRSRAEIDNSPQIFAVNVSDWGGEYQVRTLHSRRPASRARPG